MISAVKVGLSGLIAASSRMEVAANNIVHAGAQSAPFSSNLKTNSESHALKGGATYDPNRSTPAPRPGAGLQPSSTSIGAAEFSGSTSLATEIVNMKLAETAYKANIEVIRTASQMQKRLIDDIDI